jgi:hypothetical protein
MLCYWVSYYPLLVYFCSSSSEDNHSTVSGFEKEFSGENSPALVSANILLRIYKSAQRHRAVLMSRQDLISL